MAKETQKDAKAAEAQETKEGTAQGKEEEDGKQPVNESVYPASELAANAKKIFGTRQECVMAALKAAGKKGYTVTEAKGIVEKFVKREVK
jgi:hypothetical protein